MAFDIHCHFGTFIGAQTDGAVVIFYSSLQVYSFFYLYCLQCFDTVLLLPGQTHSDVTYCVKWAATAPCL